MLRLSIPLQFSPLCNILLVSQFPGDVNKMKTSIDKLKNKNKLSQEKRRQLNKKKWTFKDCVAFVTKVALNKYRNKHGIFWPVVALYAILYMLYLLSFYIDVNVIVLLCLIQISSDRQVSTIIHTAHFNWRYLHYLIWFIIF